MSQEIQSRIMQVPLLSYLREALQEDIIHHSSLTGDDIACAFLIETRTQKLFLKVVDDTAASGILEAERRGLETIEATRTIRTPGIVLSGIVDGSAFLLMEYITARQPSEKEHIRFGHQLAQLHQYTNARFGWDKDNFIGRLPQRNTWSDDWAGFYAGFRLLPQLSMARSAGLLAKEDIPNETRIIRVLEDHCPSVSPSLLHGDLWSGNYLIAENGDPVLIDPSVHYGHREVDLAMSRLFGGFAGAFYEAYAEVIPEVPDTNARNDIYQLYYLLVHLNLFGVSYHAAVREILLRYFV